MSRPMDAKSTSQTSRQITQHVLMIRPAAFGFNVQTAVSNAFQKQDDKDDAQKIHLQAVAESDGLAQLLRNNGVNVVTVDDVAKPIKPDAIFPNNWITFSHDNAVSIYAMRTPNRQLERRPAVIAQVQKHFQIDNVVNWHRLNEPRDRYCEGTGSLVFDHINKIAYAVASPRTTAELVNDICQSMGYEPVFFHAVDGQKKPIYHTNVVMCVGDTFAVVCAESIEDMKERAHVLKRLTDTHHKLIGISAAQMDGYGGNCLQLHNDKGEKLLLMSTAAYNVWTDKQRQQVSDEKTRIIHCAIPTVEKIGGGSARCMVAEIFCEPRQPYSGLVPDYLDRWLKTSPSMQVFSRQLEKAKLPLITSQMLAICLNTPRPSSHLDMMRLILCDIGYAMKWNVAVDEAGNVRWRKLGSLPVNADDHKSVADSICLQAHMDVVKQTDDAHKLTHDFYTVPVDPFIDGQWLKARGTTLGADNGIGIAAALTVMTDVSYRGPLECLFTADEETTMSGAEDIAPAPFLSSNTLINVDSEEAHSVCIGCGGGFEQSIKMPVLRVPSAEWSRDYSAKTWPLITVQVSNLRGGHSGQTIVDGRATALVILAQLLSGLKNADSWPGFIAAKALKQNFTAVDVPIPFYLLSISGGSAPNTLATSAEAQFYVYHKDLPACQSLINRTFQQLQIMYAEAENRPETKEAPKDTDVSLPIAPAQTIRQLVDSVSKKLVEVVVTMADSVAVLGEEHGPKIMDMTLDRLPQLKAGVKPDGKSKDLASPKLEMKLTLSITNTSTAVPLDGVSSSCAVDLLSMAPHGVIRAAPLDTQAETSINWAFVTIKETKDTKSNKDGKSEVLKLAFFARSSSEYQMVQLSRQLDALAHRFHATCKPPFNSFPGWQPNRQSKVLQTALTCHQAVFHKPVSRVYTVHSGLECGLFQGTYPGLDCVSIGPTILGAHTPEERLDLASCGPFLQWLKAIVLEASGCNQFQAILSQAKVNAANAYLIPRPQMRGVDELPTQGSASNIDLTSIQRVRLPSPAAKQQMLALDNS